MTRAAFSFIAAATLSATPNVAQQPYGYVGGGHLTYADTVSGTVGMVSLGLRSRSHTAAAIIEATHSRFTTGDGAWLLAGQAVAVRALGAHTHSGILATASANRLPDLWTGTATAGPLLSWTGPVTLTASATGGLVWNVDRVRMAAGTAQMRLQYDAGPAVIELGSSGTVAEGGITFLDGTAGAGIRAHSISLHAIVGVRAGDLAHRAWWQARLEAPLAPWSTLEALGGSYPRDLTGFSHGRYVSVGLRVRPPERRAPVAVRALRGANGNVRISVTFRNASTLAIAGEWNGWTPEPLTRDGGQWVKTLQLPPGTYRYSLVVDGTRWTVPDGVPTLPDGFGGVVGILLVPG